MRPIFLIILIRTLDCFAETQDQVYGHAVDFLPYCLTVYMYKFESYSTHVWPFNTINKQ